MGIKSDSHSIAYTDDDDSVRSTMIVERNASYILHGINEPQKPCPARLLPGRLWSDCSARADSARGNPREQRTEMRLIP